MNQTKKHPYKKGKPYLQNQKKHGKTKVVAKSHDENFSQIPQGI